MKSYSSNNALGLDEQLYVKRGNGKSARYHKIARFDGFPADGVWVVESDKGSVRSSCILPAGELKTKKLSDLPAPFVEKRAALERRTHEVCGVLEELRSKKGGVSNMEIADAIFRILSSEQKEDAPKRESTF